MRLPRFPFTEPVLSGEILRFAQNDRSEGFRALAHRNDNGRRASQLCLPSVIARHVSAEAI